MAQSAAAPLDRFSLPDSGGHFGRYGGVFVPETLRPVSAAVKFAVADVIVVLAAVVMVELLVLLEVLELIRPVEVVVEKVLYLVLMLVDLVL